MPSETSTVASATKEVDALSAILMRKEIVAAQRGETDRSANFKIRQFLSATLDEGSYHNLTS